MVTGRPAAIMRADRTYSPRLRRGGSGKGTGTIFEKMSVASEVLVVGMFRVEGEQGDLVAARELLEDIVAADLAAHIGREQASGFDPEQLHKCDSVTPSAVWRGR